METKDYENELAGAMNQLKTKLSDCQIIIGVLESFIYLLKKEGQKIEAKPSENGKK